MITSINASFYIYLILQYVYNSTFKVQLIWLVYKFYISVVDLDYINITMLKLYLSEHSFCHRHFTWEKYEKSEITHLQYLESLWHTAGTPFAAYPGCYWAVTWSNSAYSCVLYFIYSFLYFILLFYIKIHVRCSNNGCSLFRLLAAKWF